MTEAPQRTLPLLRGQLGLEDALGDEDNCLVKLAHPDQQKHFWASLDARRSEIEAMICSQLGVDWCRLSHVDAWASGSFNVAIPILLSSKKRVFLRLPLPYKIGEACFPGNIDEKLRTEIATYAWLEEQCPDVPIPTLHAFALSDGLVFTHPINTPSVSRKLWQIRRWILSLLGRSVPTHYVRRGLHNPLESGYLILGEAKGDPLAQSWLKHQKDASYRQRLFRDLARITISMNRTSLPRIGSWTFHSNGCITLSNRPLDLHLQMLENEGIPSGIPRHRTYTSVEPYLSDLLSFQDNKILHQPNGVQDEADGQGQLAALTALRAVTHKFIRPEYRDGPFFLSLTDLHQSNIFVDEHWNIETIIDLEWAYSKPVEMQVPPFWLTSRAVDQFEDAHAISEYESILQEFLAIHAEEEKKRNGAARYAPIQRQVWRTGGFWYFYAVTVPKGMYNLFGKHIQPLFNEGNATLSVFDKVFFSYWGIGASKTIQAKLKDKEDYDAKVREAFGCTTADIVNKSDKEPAESDEK
ncbi:hypothetical protein ACO1O0_000092 [Amphichorda felina]